MTEHPPVLSAAVGGFAAFVLAGVLEDALPSRVVALQRQVEAGRVHPALLREVTATWAAIREAGNQWVRWRSAVDGSTAGLPAAVPERSPQEIDTDRAASLLGVTPNRIRQLARDGQLPARKVARTWVVDRAAVETRKVSNSGRF